MHTDDYSQHDATTRRFAQLQYSTQSLRGGNFLFLVLAMLDVFARAGTRSR